MNKSINILHLITTLDTGGTETTLEKYLRNSPANYKHTVICLSGKGIIANQLIKNKHDVIFLHLEKKYLFLIKIIKLIVLFLKLKPSTINAWMYHACFISLFLKLCPFNKSKLIWNIRNTNLSTSLNPITTVFIAKLNAYFTSLTEFIIYNSRSAMEAHTAIGYKKNKSHIIPNGFDCNVYTPKNPSGIFKNNDKKTIGYISRYNAQKDPNTFLEAVALCTQKHKNVHFLCFGIGLDTNNKQWQKKIADLNLEMYIDSYGITKNTKDCYSEFDYFTLSSIGESFPNVIGEALACGIPIISTKAGDIEEIVEDCGILVETQSPAALADAWIEALEQTYEQREKLSLKCRERALEKYELNKIIHLYWNCFI